MGRVGAGGLGGGGLGWVLGVDLVVVVVAFRGFCGAHGVLELGYLAVIVFGWVVG